MDHISQTLVNVHCYCIPLIACHGANPIIGKVDVFSNKVSDLTTLTMVTKAGHTVHKMYQTGLMQESLLLVYCLLWACLGGSSPLEEDSAIAASESCMACLSKRFFWSPNC